MKYSDLHPYFRLRFWNKRHAFTAEDFQRLERLYGPLKKGELPWILYVSVLTGVAFVVAVAAFDLWRYFTGLFLAIWILIEFLPFKNNRTSD